MTRLVVVDDHEMVRKTIETIVRAGTDWEVVSYESGTTFLAGPLELVDCLLLDLRMPKMSGWEVVRQLQIREAKFPIVLMSGHTNELDATPELVNGIERFLAKPFSGHELFRVIAEVTSG